MKWLLRWFTKPLIMVGYQGWFGCPGDGSRLNSWFHWSKDIPIWPDVSELAETYNFEDKKVYSAYNENTVSKHFEWMSAYSVDGAFLQRFACELSNELLLDFRNKVLSNVRKAAEQQGILFSVMYDISGQDSALLYETLISDWESIKEVVNSSAYYKQNDKPVVAIWGLGFLENNCTPEIASSIISYFKNKGCVVIGGVPMYYQSQDRDCKSGWKNVFDMLDVINPWTVGRYTDIKSFKSDFTSVFNMIAALWKGQKYMQTIFPGFAFTDKPSISRDEGNFFQYQLKNTVSKLIYVAMFDEVDEATAIYKLSGTNPSDKYLQLIKQS